MVAMDIITGVGTVGKVITGPTIDGPTTIRLLTTIDPFITAELQWSRFHSGSIDLPR